MARKKLRLVIRIALLAGTLASMYFVPWPIIYAWIWPIPETVQEQVDQAIGYGFDGIIVYVNQSGKPSEFYAAGWHNRADKIPADPRAIFKIASITKLYNAVTVAKLVNEKRLLLDKTLAEYFPDYADRFENADQITLRMMVQHRSGIPNVTDTKDFWINPPEGTAEALKRVFDLPAAFEPDSQYGYSNTNYLLINELVDQVVGYSHQQYIKEQILMPLGLKNTFGTLSEVDPDDVMSGYYVGIEEDLKMEDYGSLTMFASAEDVGIFLRALNDGSVFREDEQEIYSSIYGYEHTGLVPGYQSIAKYHSDIDAVVIQFVNTTNFEGYTWSLSEIAYNRIVKILRNRRQEPD